VVENIVYGGKNVYGYKIGILMLDSQFPRIKGDIGNAETWNYPVLFKKVENAYPEKIVKDLSDDFLHPFIEAAKELEDNGVKAITTSCGFLAPFQDRLANAVSIPVYTSSLVQVPVVCNMVGSNAKVGILTVNSSSLSEEHLKSVNIDINRVVVEGMETREEFVRFTLQNSDYVDVNKCKEELVDGALQIKNNNPEVQALVLECTNMPPYSDDIRKATGLPVFDIVTFTNMIYSAL